jgi:hypothetical protein
MRKNPLQTRKMIPAKELNKSNAVSDNSKREDLEKEEYSQDRSELDHETLTERLKHHKNAVKNLEKEIQSLKNDESEDTKDVKRESDAASDKQKEARQKFLEMIRKKKGGDKKSDDKKSDDKGSSKKEESKSGMKEGESTYPDLGKPSDAKTKFDKARAADAVKIEVKRQGEVLEVDIEEAAQRFFGGKKRSNLKNSDFLFPAKRSFPIATPADVPDAVSNFGRMSGNMPYDEFKRKLVSFVKKKGSKFVAALPSTIKKEFDLVDATQIAVFPDKYVDPKDVGTVFQDTRPINHDGYEIDDKLQEQIQKDKLKNPQLRSAQQRAEGLR